MASDVFLLLLILGIGTTAWSQRGQGLYKHAVSRVCLITTSPISCPHTLKTPESRNLSPHLLIQHTQQLPASCDVNIMSQAPAFQSPPSSPESDYGMPESPGTSLTPPSHNWYIMSQAPAAPTPAYRFPSAEVRRSFVEQHAEFIVEMMKCRSMELFDCKDPIVQMASTYIYGIQEENASRKWSTRIHLLDYKVTSNNSVN